MTDSVSNLPASSNVGSTVVHRCPRDATALSQRQGNGLIFWHCATCSGLWLPSGVFKNEIGYVSITGRGSLTGLACPGDGHWLTVVLHRGVEVDVCGKCGGIWFDHGEIKNLLGQRGDPARTFLDAPSGSTLGDVAMTAVDIYRFTSADAAGEVVSAVFEFLGELVS